MEVERMAEKYVYTQYVDYGDWGYKAEEQIEDGFIAGYKSAKEENNKLIEYIEHKYGIVINREDLDNFLNRE